jgi:hypothetical protein
MQTLEPKSASDTSPYRQGIRFPSLPIYSSQNRKSSGSLTRFCSGSVTYLLHILPRGMARVRYKGIFRTLGRVDRLLLCQELITAAGLNRRAPDTPGTARLIGHEHDEDEMEECEPNGWELSSKPGCGRCGGKMEGNRDDWLSADATRSMLKTVASILMGLDRGGESLLIQIQEALTWYRSDASRCYSSYTIRLIESMLLECIEDPRPLMRSVLGKDHPLIREADRNAARPPPEREAEAANA